MITTKWKRFLRHLAKRGLWYNTKNMPKQCFIWLWVTLFLVSNGCAVSAGITRGGFLSILPDICKSKYQTRVTCKEIGDTVWVYLPYTPGRSGLAASKEEGNDLYVEYQVASFNPYKVIEPPELKFLVQKVLGEIRKLLLQTRNPYKFFVLVVTDISSRINDYEDWYIGYLDDLREFPVCIDFSGEGHRRLAWHRQKIEVPAGSEEQAKALSYGDAEGVHIRYHNITLREFVDKQIKWRIYKEFTLEYNKTPFDLTAEEKKDEVIKIVQTVFKAYNFKEYENIYLRDSSFMDEHKTWAGYKREDMEEYKTGRIIRKPAF